MPTYTKQQIQESTIAQLHKEFEYGGYRWRVVTDSLGFQLHRDGQLFDTFSSASGFPNRIKQVIFGEYRSGSNILAGSPIGPTYHGG